MAGELQALQQVREAFNTVDDPAPGASKSVVYFLTDGNPLAPPSQGGGRLTEEDVKAWEAFLSDPTNNITRAYAIGIGDGDSRSDRRRSHPLVESRTEAAPEGVGLRPQGEDHNGQTE